jgi:integral membrane protein
MGREEYGEPDFKSTARPVGRSPTATPSRRRYPWALRPRPSTARWEGTVLDTPIGRLRVVGFVEGISYLLLLFVAMPLKYLYGMPEAVRVVGMAHGVLFLLFVAALVHAARAGRWPLLRAAWGFASAVIPFGTFVLDAQLRREQERAALPA